MIHLFERIPSKLATISISFDAGARAEGIGFSCGLAHMLEHCCFLGTSKRNRYQIPREIGLLGGSFNASTSVEQVMFYITVPYNNIEPAMEILSDLVFNSTFPEEEMNKEREVVKEEEKSYQDDVHSLIYERFCAEFFTGRLSQPVLGTQETIDSFTLSQLKYFHKKYYTESNCIVSLSGNFSNKEGKFFLSKYFGKNTGKNTSIVQDTGVDYKPTREVRFTRPQLEHSYVWLAYPGNSFKDGDEAVEDIALNILGQDMDSRLFTEVREKRGLVYSIQAGSMAQRDCGAIIVSFSTRPENVAEAIEVVEAEIKKMKQELVTDEELIRAKNKYLASSYGLTENSRASATNNIVRKFYGLQSMDDLVERSSKVNADEIKDIIVKLFDDSKRLTLICEGENE